MMLKPIKDKLLVQVVKEERKSGLIIPDDKKKGKKLEMAKVITYGSEVEQVIKSAKNVYIDHFAGTPVEMDGESYLMIKEEEVQGYE